jgi:hypothetical protein
MPQIKASGDNATGPMNCLVGLPANLHVTPHVDVRPTLARFAEVVSGNEPATIAYGHAFPCWSHILVIARHSGVTVITTLTNATRVRRRRRSPAPHRVGR